MSIIILTIYSVIGVLFSLYALGCHIKCLSLYFRQLYTAKDLTPCKLRTYFGQVFWDGFNEDYWGEVLFISSLVTLWTMLLVCIGWPFSIIFYLNNSINKARARINEDT